MSASRRTEVMDFACFLLRLLDSNRRKTCDSRGIHVNSRKEDRTRVDASARESTSIGPKRRAGGRGRSGAREGLCAGAPLTVEDALAAAIVEASRARRWAVVAQLVRELEARRLEAGRRSGGACRKSPA